MSEYIGGRYQLIKLVGSGGMANVYLALDTILNREVAIKILKEEQSKDRIAVERFAREAGASTSLSHPNIVDVYDVGEDEGKHYIVMEYVKGYTLKQLLRKRGAIPYKEAVWLMKQLSGALMEAHKNGIIHRDVKSQNVLIKDDGTIKMADFGIAIIGNELDLESKDSVLGSVHYIAPEITKGGNATMQSDIYSLGIVFYELLTGDVPFKGDTAAQVALKHIKEEIPSVRLCDPKIPQSVENIIIKSTAKSPVNRYKNIALMIKDLYECLKSEHLNDPKAVLDRSEEIKTMSSIRIAENGEAKLKSTKSSDKKKKAEKTESRIHAVLLALVTIFSLLALVIVLFLTGFFSPKKTLSTVPDIANRTIIEAEDLLSDLELTIDYSNIERVMTDDIDEGLIISFYPDKGSEVDKGTKIRITVSEGIYSVMEDYRGKNVQDVTAYLEEKGFKVATKSVESDYEPGTILMQSGLNPGDKYNASITNNVYFEYSEYSSIEIPFDIQGTNVFEAENVLTHMSEGIQVDLQAKDRDFFTERELEKYPDSYTIVRITPDAGSIYTQEKDSVITIYYYEEQGD